MMVEDPRLVSVVLIPTIIRVGSQCDTKFESYGDNDIVAPPP